MSSNSASFFEIAGYLRRQSSIIDQALGVRSVYYPGESLAALARDIVGCTFISILHGRTEEVYA